MQFTGLAAEDLALDRLSPAQRDQLWRQVRYHLEAPPYETVSLAPAIQLRLDIAREVTRPMSSKLLAEWLWARRAWYQAGEVLDIGTGCGVQGLTCLLGGAAKVLMTDVGAQAVACAEVNAARCGLRDGAEFQVSDLFENLVGPRSFDLIIFAQPFFEGAPIEQFPFTRGMLDEGDLLLRFFGRAGAFLRPGGACILMGWSFAGERNDPARVAPRFGFRVRELVRRRGSDGVQSGDFLFYVFEAMGRGA